MPYVTVPDPPPLSPLTPVEPPETPEDYDKLIARERKKLARILHARDRYLAEHELLMDACEKTKTDATAAATTKAALSQRETEPSSPTRSDATTTTTAAASPNSSSSADQKRKSALNADAAEFVPGGATKGGE